MATQSLGDCCYVLLGWLGGGCLLICPVGGGQTPPISTVLLSVPGGPVALRAFTDGCETSVLIPKIFVKHHKTLMTGPIHSHNDYLVLLSTH